jgi:phospho-N-acetylmuramoyl-pentapeptide-transferase
LTLALAGLSFMLSVIWGPPLLRILRHYKVGKAIRVDGPERHFAKVGTPTMGGILIILPVLLLTVLLNISGMLGITVMGRSVLLPVGTMLLFGLLGAVDDWAGLRGKRKALGLSARTKMFYQVIFAVGIAFVIKYLFKTPDLFLPGVKGQVLLGVWYVPMAAFLIVASSNAVNFTDGLDGLAGLISATAFAAYGGIALLQGQIFLARFCFTVVGAIFGFLWFNVHPALMIMGDTGSLAIGASLAVVALMTGQWLLYPIIAIIPTSETLSVTLQVGYFKLTHGKRLFKMAPLHHHFELLGWSETQVVQRFWLIGLMFAMVGIALAVA